MTKYGAKKVELDGYTFDSRAEANRYSQLKLLERARAIKSLAVHPKYPLRASNGNTVCVYEADFAYVEGSQFVAEDVKGVATPMFRLKAKWFRECYPGVDLRITDKKGNRRVIRTRAVSTGRAAA